MSQNDDVRDVSEMGVRRRVMGVVVLGTISLSVVVSAVVLLTTLTGCDAASCTEVQRNYDRTVNREAGLAELTETGAPHLAMAIRLDLLNDLSAGLIDTAVGEALGKRGSLRVSGQTIDYAMSSTGANLRLDASSACDTCLRIRGDIDGEAAVTLPVVGRQSSPLTGSLDWTMPLAVGRDDDGKVAIFLDTAEALRMGVPTLQGRMSALPDSWSNLVASALASELADEVANAVPPIRLIGYEMPSLGLRGLEMTPSLFAFDSNANALVLGVRTNLAVAQSQSSRGDLMSALALSDGQNIALGVAPGAVMEAVRLGMQQDRVPRRYNLAGSAQRDGTAHAVVDNFGVGSHSGAADALAMGLDFRLFNFGSGWGCFSMDGNSRSRLAINNGRLELDVEEVEFTGSGIANAANWASAQFIQHTQGVVAHTLNDDIVFSPDVGMSLRGDRVSTAAGLLVLRGQGSPTN